MAWTWQVLIFSSPMDIYVPRTLMWKRVILNPILTTYCIQGEWMHAEWGSKCILLNVMWRYAERYEDYVHLLLEDPILSNSPVPILLCTAFCGGEAVTEASSRLRWCLIIHRFCIHTFVSPLISGSTFKCLVTLFPCFIVSFNIPKGDPLRLEISPMWGSQECS